MGTGRILCASCGGGILRARRKLLEYIPSIAGQDQEWMASFSASAVASIQFTTYQ